MPLPLPQATGQTIEKQQCLCYRQLLYKTLDRDLPLSEPLGDLDISWASVPSLSPASSSRTAASLCSSFWAYAIEFSYQKAVPEQSTQSGSKVMFTLEQA